MEFKPSRTPQWNRTILSEDNGVLDSLWITYIGNYEFYIYATHNVLEICSIIYKMWLFHWQIEDTCILDKNI
jgi:hypothetical protein